jgi:predicted metal-dependent peptidase
LPCLLDERTNDAMSAESALRLMAARVRLLNTHPYLAQALVRIETFPVAGIGTLAVDNWWRLAYDPDILDAWSVPEIAGVLYHEVLHLLRDHAGRAGSRDAEAWNVACDAEINDDLRDESFTQADGSQHRIELPGSPIFPESLGQRPHLTAEEYYRDAAQQGAGGSRERGSSEPSVGSGRCGSAATGVPEAWEATLGGASPKAGDTPTTSDGNKPGDRSEGNSPGDMQATTESVDVGVSPGEAEVIRWRVAQEITKSRATAPAHLERLAERELEPERIDWRRELRSIIARTITTVSGAVDYSYSRPSRRQSAVAGVVLPALRAPVVRVAVVVDTSGSMSGRELGAALEQINSILRSVGAREGLVVLAVDAEVHVTKQVFRANEVNLVGGGGTDMRVGIEAAARLRPRPEVVIVLTDGFTPWPNVPPRGMRVIAGVIGNAQVSVPDWMKVVRITS